MGMQVEKRRVCLVLPDIPTPTINRQKTGPTVMSHNS